MHHIHLHQVHGYMHHSYMHHKHTHQDQKSYIYASWIHAYMHPGQGSRIIDISIMNRVMDHRYMHHTHMQHPTPRIGLSVRSSGKNPASWTHASLIRVNYHSYLHHLYLHHTHIHQDQGSYIFTSWIHESCKYLLGSRIIDMCIIHTCIRVKDRGS